MGFCGVSWGVWGDFMGFLGGFGEFLVVFFLVLWDFMVFGEISWDFLAVCGVAWDFLGALGEVSWFFWGGGDFVGFGGFYGISCVFLETVV